MCFFKGAKKIFQIYPPRDIIHNKFLEEDMVTSDFNEKQRFKNSLHKLTHNYTDNPNSEFLEKKYQQLCNLAAGLGIDAVIIKKEHGFELGFETQAELVKFNRIAFNPKSEPGSHIHREEFVDSDPEFIEAWAQAVRDVAVFSGVFCDVEVKGNEVTIYFDTPEDLLGFAQLRDQGYFSQAAHAAMNIPPQADITFDTIA